MVVHYVLLVFDCNYKVHFVLLSVDVNYVRHYGIERRYIVYVLHKTIANHMQVKALRVLPCQCRLCLIFMFVCFIQTGCVLTGKVYNVMVNPVTCYNPTPVDRIQKRYCSALTNRAFSCVL